MTSDTFRKGSLGEHSKLCPPIATLDRCHCVLLTLAQPSLLVAADMCRYAYAFYFCGHDYFIYQNTLEHCGNRYLSAHSIDAWSIDLCKDSVVTCDGISSSYCTDCNENNILEFELDE